MALTTVERVEYMSYPHELAEAFELYTFARNLNALAYVCHVLSKSRSLSLNRTLTRLSANESLAWLAYLACLREGSKTNPMSVMLVFVLVLF